MLTATNKRSRKIMNTKEREQFLLMFLPACLVVITYAIFFYSPSQKTAQAARSQLEDVRQKAPTEQDLLTAKNLLEVATQTQATVQEEVNRVQEEIVQFCATFGDESRRFQTIQNITAWLQDHPLSLLAQAAVREPTLSTVQRAALQRISSHLEKNRIQYREFQLEGTYLDMVQFLQRFTKSETPIYPVSLEMTSSANEDGQHIWSFVVAL